MKFKNRCGHGHKSGAVKLGAGHPGVSVLRGADGKPVIALTAKAIRTIAEESIRAKEV